ncbi:MAG: redoxin domain-containing protein [Tannerellaceae bacterium]|jgi:hypothetical protein|nr:redoxin domain-containing protein [Tannerellaceae bacterium]
MRRAGAIWIPVAVAAALVTWSCSDAGKKFTVSGEVVQAADETLFLEAVTMDGIQVLDSVLLDESGKYRFSSPRPEYPEFYRLRLNDRHIHFAIDSTESITISTSATAFATSYTVAGSPNNDAIREISLATLEANQALTRLHRSIRMGLTDNDQYTAARWQIVEAYKNIALRYIYTIPHSTAAYFALFQQADGMLLFDIYDRKDSKAFGAVATSYDLFFRDGARAKHLRDVALQSLAVIRRSTQKNGLEGIDAKEVGFLDITLPNVHGKVISLSDVMQGNVTLINFTAYSTDWSPAINMKLNDLHEAYGERGLLIYQVSLDNDVHLWSNAAINAPWVTVIDPQSYYSEIAALYAVRQLPAFFLLDRLGNVVKRIEHMDDIEKEINLYL